ncbi:endo-1,4-beta-xylanase [Streptomyces cinnabarinus]|uniref:Endo-1,4-beta-xylanase n=1 Tax=Streptomyces cinnabarinus TaxID=67287 RepID=A0ABY7KVP0_9ACTN|nr:endo-1,4-beta-xylanase [Streptomyces cinnabarinus]WAZ26801.1 endo-1,4-beta-xylanase [Streptomyces cinnabarinus]
MTAALGRRSGSAGDCDDARFTVQQPAAARRHVTPGRADPRKHSQWPCGPALRAAGAAGLASAPVRFRCGGHRGHRGRVYKWAVQNGKQVRGHTLAWHSRQMG